MENASQRKEKRGENAKQKAILGWLEVERLDLKPL